MALKERESNTPWSDGPPSSTNTVMLLPLPLPLPLFEKQRRALFRERRPPAMEGLYVDPRTPVAAPNTLALQPLPQRSVEDVPCI